MPPPLTSLRARLRAMGALLFFPGARDPERQPPLVGERLVE